MRPCGGLRVVLHGVGRDVEALDPLDHVVVEADVRDARPSVGCVAVAVEGRVDREAVVVRRHLDLARRAVHDRLVDAPVSVLELVGAEPESPTEQLVAEADAEERDPASSTWRSSATSASAVAGSPGPFEKNTPSGRAPPRRQVVEGGRRGSTCTSIPCSAISCGVIALIPRSIAATVNRVSPFRDEVRLGWS